MAQATRAAARSLWKEIGLTLLFILVCQLAGAIGSLATQASLSTWYEALAKPSFNPPSWVFAPVWTTLYTLMGIAAYLVWRRGWHRQDVKRALGVFAVQLVLNAAWSLVFFGLQAPLGGLVVIVLLLAAIVLTMRAFFPLSRTAGWLLVPYVLWVAFATVLNGSIWLLNS
jgi:benzodiazapine receptor